MINPLSWASPHFLREFAFTTPFGSPPAKTPWLLIREVRYDTDQEPSLPTSRLETFGSINSFMPYQPVTTQFHALFTPISGYFSAFAHATNSLSVSGICLDLDVGTPIFVLQPRSTTLFWRLLWNLTYGAITLFGLPFQGSSAHSRASCFRMPEPHLPCITAWYSV